MSKFKNIIKPIVNVSKIIAVSPAMFVMYNANFVKDFIINIHDAVMKK